MPPQFPFLPQRFPEPLAGAATSPQRRAGAGSSPHRVQLAPPTMPARPAYSPSRTACPEPATSPEPSTTPPPIRPTPTEESKVLIPSPVPALITRLSVLGRRVVAL
ncbi:hypothetical protein GCM10010244_70960 [Streptomyces coeruleorubidus]|nr:hypothetical protein GCM10010244_70960 [Streptomyces bellus]